VQTEWLALEVIGTREGYGIGAVVGAGVNWAAVVEGCGVKAETGTVLNTAAGEACESCETGLICIGCDVPISCDMTVWE